MVFMWCFCMKASVTVSPSALAAVAVFASGGIATRIRGQRPRPRMAACKEYANLGRVSECFPVLSVSPPGHRP